MNAPQTSPTPAPVLGPTSIEGAQLLVIVEQLRQLETKIAELKQMLQAVEGVLSEHRDVLYGNEKQGIQGLNARFTAVLVEAKTNAGLINAEIARREKQEAALQNRVNGAIAGLAFNTTIGGGLLLALLRMLGVLP